MLFSIAALSLAITDPEPRIVDVDGAKVAYNVSQDEHGRTVLAGKRLDDGRPFQFIVEQDGRVRGTIGAEVVRFRAPR